MKTGAFTITIDKVPATGGVSTNVQIGALLPAQIRNGAYTFWNYEYIMWKSTVVTGDKLTFATALKNRVLNFDYGFSGLSDELTTMKVQRDSDGAFVYPK